MQRLALEDLIEDQAMVSTRDMPCASHDIDRVRLCGHLMEDAIPIGVHEGEMLSHSCGESGVGSGR